MTLTVSLDPVREARLRELADAAGEDVSTFVARWLARELDAPAGLISAADAFAREVDDAGVSDAEFDQSIQAAIATSRRAAS
jgi:hypothetical protein